jgi:hypothetical protein
MSSSTDSDAIWTREAKVRIQQEFGWAGAALYEKFTRFLAEGGWAEPGATIVEAFADWAREKKRA